MKKIDAINHFLIVLAAFLFIFFYLSLSWFNRPASDDLIFLLMTKEQSVVSSVQELYTNWSGRWTSATYLFTVFSLFKLEQISFWIQGYYLFTLVLISYSLTVLLRALIKKIFLTTINYALAFVYAILFIAAFFYFTIDHIEVWWWISATFYYLQGIVFLLFGLTLLIKEKKQLLHYGFIVLCFLFVGACFEIYVLILLSLFSIVGFYYLKNRNTVRFETNYRPYVTGTMLAFVAFGISAIVCLSAPGNQNRQKKILHTEQINNKGLTINSVLQKKYLLGIGISSLFVFLGRRIQQEKKEILYFKKTLFIVAIPFIVSIIITSFFQLFVLKDFSIPLRGWTFSSFSFSVFSCTLFICIGYTIQAKHSVLEKGVKMMLPFTICILLFWIAIKQFKDVQKYAQAYDRMIEKLIEARDTKETGPLYIEVLPPSGMLIPLNLTDAYDQIPLKKIVGVDFRIETEK